MRSSSPAGSCELRIEEKVPDRIATEIVRVLRGRHAQRWPRARSRTLGTATSRRWRAASGRWKEAGPADRVPRTLSAPSSERYSRHLPVPEIGEAGQAKLLDSKVLLVGAGGLGSPAGLYLAAAGVGTIGIVDDDVVDRSNLQRQVLHTNASVGRPKTESAAATLTRAEPGRRAWCSTGAPDRHQRARGPGALRRDRGRLRQLPTKYLVNDGAVLLEQDGGVRGASSGSTVRRPCLRRARGPATAACYPEPTPAEMAPSCDEAGVLRRPARRDRLSSRPPRR